MAKHLIKLVIIPVFVSGCYTQVSNKNTKDLTKAFIQVKPEEISLTVDTKTLRSGHPTQVVTFTNVGMQPATKLELKGFKDESAPIEIINNCEEDLAVGDSCTVKFELYNSYKLASSAPVSRSTVMKYEYNNGYTKQSDSIKVKFNLEKWIASVFLTNSKTSGAITYPLPENIAPIKPSTDSADYYCRVDKNNPQNGYKYYALLYNTPKRTPYLNWVLVGGKTYFSVMPDVYHQKVWQTSYTQATAPQLIKQLYNCIGTDCINNHRVDDPAWVGLWLTKDHFETNTCGLAGTSWKLNKESFEGTEVKIGGDPHHSVTMTNENASCATQKKLICVSI